VKISKLKPFGFPLTGGIMVISHKVFQLADHVAWDFVPTGTWIFFKPVPRGGGQVSGLADKKT